MFLMALALATSLDETPYGNVTLHCEQSATQSYPLTMHDFYPHDIPTKEQFAQDVFDFGIIGIAVIPTKIWEIDFSAETVTQVGSGFPVLRIDEVTPTRLSAQIYGEQYVRRFNINRVTGQAALLITASVTAWNAKFNANLTSFRVWDLKCQPVSKPVGALF